ncbi:MAG: hypothetical protein PVS3B3_30680 [Ktedonobacteraceae bacterium]
MLQKVRISHVDPRSLDSTIRIRTRQRVVVLVPAHNEEATIQRTVESLCNQTYPIQQIIVLCDNCTDRTEEVVKFMQRRNRRIKVTHTQGNTARKAGALNYGYSLLDNNVDILVQMDADTVLSSNIIEMGVHEFETAPNAANFNLGGICSRFLVAKPIGKMSWLGWFLWHLQNIEYGFADADRIMMINQDARVLSGTCSMYRKNVLDEIAKMRPMFHGLPQVWDVQSIVEDYVLTNDVRALGYTTKCSYHMVNLTNVPESFKEYWKQRERWYSGTIDELRKRGMTHYTAADILAHAFGLFMTANRIIFYGLVIFLLVNHLGIQPNPLTFLIPLVVYIYNVYRFKYVKVNRSWTEAVMVFTLIPLELYAILREVLMIRSYYLSFFKRKRGW